MPCSLMGRCILSLTTSIESCLPGWGTDLMGSPTATSFSTNLRVVEKDAAEAEETLRKIWKTTCAIALETGAATAHHHGTGIARLPVVREELGSSMKLLERVKNSLDPSHILCPGKLGVP